MPDKAELPDDIEAQMKMWRLGEAAMPRSYIGFHQRLAEKAVEGLKGLGLIVHRTFMADDGWMDGMRSLVVIAERKSDGELLKLQWQDGNQEFFVRLPGHRGSVPFRPAQQPCQFPGGAADAAVQDS